jgi:hypothetical protein
MIITVVTGDSGSAPGGVCPNEAAIVRAVELKKLCDTIVYVAENEGLVPRNSPIAPRGQFK